MADIALSKSSLQQQRDRLRLFERFLPSLELKRQQLTAEYKKAMYALRLSHNRLDLFHATSGSSRDVIDDDDQEQ